ncbi:MAG: DUF6273 domain-containing protein [Oscillospiraceae bacterium]|jgi:hypothetical protein|nr:DUF6273 domain-containing protein [Oscillospiraceae bacterium]
MKKLISITLAIALLISISAILSGCNTKEAQKVGDTLDFGGYSWRILDITEGKALIITEDIIELRYFDTKTDDLLAPRNWATCELRRYLNGEFYNKFSSDEKARISETKNTTPNNPEHGTNGGADTTDKVFLLSVNEVETYFKTVKDRIATYEGTANYWWLRSPGRREYDTAHVWVQGDIFYSFHGEYMGIKGGVRPALWLTL